ncbi:basic leucine zipper transcriptional factor ATF-like isoform X2 [Canis lupus dingo]|uniref:basic leucine zipper transcriptional factor ATF-like isoform X2 n=1 Tax=Canis lupus dingo TaxID=286419 RepID=UPI0020C42482|nr:basic leucine zipper transcriptional factor ATF-like isoform X2 [Canis lupus dingo]
MPHSSDSSDSSFSRSPPPGKQDSSDDVRKVQRREKNRIAAQKSRQRQTQKADTLHLDKMARCANENSCVQSTRIMGERRPRETERGSAQGDQAAHGRDEVFHVGAEQP